MARQAQSKFIMTDRLQKPRISRKLLSRARAEILQTDERTLQANGNVFTFDSGVNCPSYRPRMILSQLELIKALSLLGCTAEKGSVGFVNL